MRFRGSSFSLRSRTVVSNVISHLLFTKELRVFVVGITGRARTAGAATRFCLPSRRLTAIITLRCLRDCEPCQFPAVVLGPTPRTTPLRARRNTAEFSINNVTGKLRRKNSGPRRERATPALVQLLYASNAQSYSCPPGTGGSPRARLV